MRSAAPRPASVVADGLAARQRSISYYVRRVERSVGSGQLAKSDLKHAYAGAILAYADDVEAAMERLFVGLLVGSLVCRPRAITRVDVHSPVVARELLLRERRFIDWLPFTVAEERAGVFFRGGEPFSRLSSQQKEPFERLRVVRNALAHRSDHALRQFERKLLSRHVPAAQQNPAGWLRGSHTGTQTRFENLLATVGRSMRDLSK